MQIDINEHQQIRLKDIFEPIELVSTNGETLIVCARNGGFEIGIEKSEQKSPDSALMFSYFKIINGNIEHLVMQNK